MSQLPDAYVAYIGLKSVTLGGSDCLKYSLANHEFRRGYTVNRFDSEEQVNNFLQSCIDNRLSFADDVKSNAYQEGTALVKTGILSGDVIVKPNFTGT